MTNRRQKNYTHLALGEILGLFASKKKMASTRAGRGAFLTHMLLGVVFTAVGTDSTEGTADVVIAEPVERIGARAVVAGVIGKPFLPVDDQINIEIREFVLSIIE